MLLLSADTELKRNIHHLLAPAGVLLETVTNGQQIPARIKSAHFDLLLTDDSCVTADFLSWLHRHNQTAQRPTLITLTRQMTADNCVFWLRAGARDMVQIPLDQEALMLSLQRTLATQPPGKNAPIEHPSQQHTPLFFGQNAGIQLALSNVEKLASTRVPLLIEGETGTGKGLFARKLHELSGRRGPFVAVNCAAISANLLESELFGHIKGAFTGATEARAGLFASAEDGTLFLDEIGEMPLDLQPKLLHVLESGSVRRVGSNREERINARVVAATNQDLNSAVQEGRFRADLFYRLNTVHLNLPPLRDRLDDLEGLIQHFSQRLSQDMDLPPAPCSAEGLTMLKHYAWPGNVRELRNYIERAMLLGFPLGEHLPTAQPVAQPSGAQPGASLSLETREKQYVLETLTLCGGNKSRTADMLGISRRTLDRKLKLWQSSRLTA